MSIAERAGLAHIPDWTGALCAQADPEAWFSDGKGSKRRPAMRVCAACPLQDPCLDHALANPDLSGVWGGTTEKQRQRMRRSAA